MALPLLYRTLQQSAPSLPFGFATPPPLPITCDTDSHTIPYFSPQTCGRQHDERCKTLAFSPRTWENRRSPGKSARADRNSRPVKRKARLCSAGPAIPVRGRLLRPGTREPTSSPGSEPTASPTWRRTVCAVARPSAALAARIGSIRPPRNRRAGARHGGAPLPADRTGRAARSADRPGGTAIPIPAAPTAVRRPGRRDVWRAGPGRADRRAPHNAARRPLRIRSAAFLADKLSWDQEGTPPLAQTIADAWQRGSAAAPPAHIRYARSHGMVLVPHGWLLEAERRPQTEA